MTTGGWYRCAMSVFRQNRVQNELMSRIAGPQMVWKYKGMPCEHLAAYQSYLGCFWSAKRPLPSAFSAAKRLSVAQTSSWKVPPNGPKTLLKCIPAVARRYSHFTAKTGVMLLAGLSPVKLSCQIVSRTFLLIRKTFPSSRTGPQKPLRCSAEK